MARHRAPCLRARSHEYSQSRRHPLLRVAAKWQGYSAPLLAGAARVSPVIGIAMEETEGDNETSPGVGDNAHRGFSGCWEIPQTGYCDYSL
jgi:hypothetical protein